MVRSTDKTSTTNRTRCFRHPKLHAALIALLAVVLVAVNIAAYIGSSYLNIVTNKLQLDTSSEAAQTAMTASRDVAKQMTAEGIVMLRNENNTLPLQKNTKINLFGWSSTAMVVGGSGGSGGAANASIDIKTSLENAGFDVNDDLYQMYVKYQKGRETGSDKEYGGYSPSWGTPEPSISDTTYYTKELLDGAKTFSDTAIFTIGRTSGEGIDLPAGYLALTQEEKDCIKYLTENYAKTIVLVNSNAAMELGYLEEIGVGAVLFMPGPGDEGADSLGRILNGDVNPSGRLVDTFAYDHTSSPSYYDANRPGTMEYSDKEGYYYVDYSEGIYAGYKYYETAGADGYIDYEKTVQYPFGYGLSYTTFDQHVTAVHGDLSSNEITVDVAVTNTGDVSGKEVVQLYATPEYHKGGIEKASVDLVGFAKTDELEPGASQTVTVTVDPYEIASYDWNDANHDGKTGYVLEAGKYELKLMGNAHDLIAVARTYDLTNPIYIDQDPVTGARITNLFDDVAGQDETEPVTYLSRADFAGTFPKKPESNTGRAASQAVKDSDDVSVKDDGEAQPITTDAKNDLTVADMAGLDADDAQWDKLLDQLSMDDMTSLILNAGFGTSAIKSIGLAESAFCDGPQGLQTFMNTKGTVFPVEMYLAQTWNIELAAQQGADLAAEAKAMGVSAIYGPAVNIHRTPYSGRNFEYYSEDGYQSGMMAAAVVKAEREHGIAQFVKHFALNDQETYRGEFFTSLYTWANEQSMREIYLKGFEYAVKGGNALGIMTSFNRVGASWTGASKALCTDLLRGEWGFDGATTTDLFQAGADEYFMNPEQGIRAGQDSWLTLFDASSELKLDTSKAATQNAMRNAVKHTLYLLANTTIPAEKSTFAAWLWFGVVPFDVLMVVGIGVYASFLVKSVRRKRQLTATADAVGDADGKTAK